jgi:DNA polymerase III subunit delta'
VDEILRRWGIIGHEWAVRLLERSLELETLAQSFLFLGPPRVGKSTLALALARAINCTGEVKPCGVCRSCRLIAAGKHPDVRLIEGGEVRAILIDQVRSLQHEAALSPVEARRRVTVLSDFQGATTEAANCLLKTLEEPPRQVVLILTATQQSRLLPTIVSRCQPFWMRPPSGPQIADGLQALYGVEPTAATHLARLAGGRVGWAVEAARDGELLAERTEQVGRLAEVLHSDTLARLRLAKALSARPDDLPGLLDVWAGWWRDLLLQRTGCPELIAAEDVGGQVAKTAASLSPEALWAGLKAIGETRRQLDANANPRLALEVLFLNLGST